MTNSFLYRMPAAIAGNVTRTEHSTVEAGLSEAGYLAPAYGVVLKLVAGLYRPLVSGDAGTTVVGFLVRPYPVQSWDAGGAASPELAGPIYNVLKRGYIGAVVTSGGAVALGSITKGLQVYVCNNVSGGVVGEFQSGSTGNNTPVPEAFFMGAADSNGMVEIAYNI